VIEFSKTKARAITPEDGAGRDRTATRVALCLATAAEYWTSTGVSLILTDLTGTLIASSDEASWALTVYSTAFAVSVALSHRLSHFFGNRRYLASCVFLYAVTSIGCALSIHLGSFLFFRALEDFAGGAFLVRSFVFLSQQYDPKSRSIALTAYGISFSLWVDLSHQLLAEGWLTRFRGGFYLDSRRFSRSLQPFSSTSTPLNIGQRRKSHATSICPVFCCC
jgi:MFS family permease